MKLRTVFEIHGETRAQIIDALDRAIGEMVNFSTQELGDLIKELEDTEEYAQTGSYGSGFVIEYDLEV